MASSNGEFIPFIMFGVGLFLLYSGITRYLLLQKIKNTPTSKIRSAAVGLVELFGKAKCKEEETDPLFKKKCVFWELIAKYYHPGKHGGWRNIYNKKSEPQFYLEDETGKILINPKNAEIEIPIDLNSSNSYNNLDLKVLSYAFENNEFGEALRRYSSYKLWVTEKFIAEDDDLYALGSAMPLDGASSSISNENLVVKKNNFDKILYISDSGERKVIEKMSSGVMIGIVAGFLLSVAGFAGILLVLKIF